VTGLKDLERISGQKGDKMTLKERILSFQMEVQKKDGSTGQTQIFKAIDQNKHGAGYIFTFHPDAKEIAQEYFAGLNLFLQTGLTEEELTKYFIPEEIRRGKNLRWKIEGKRVISADDLEVERLLALDEDMIIMEGYQLSASDERDLPRQDKMDDETIYTTNETANKRRQIDADRGDHRAHMLWKSILATNSAVIPLCYSTMSQSDEATTWQAHQITSQLPDKTLLTSW
jgi:hypothetical protein